ncbi:NADPH-dependent F420 reductase [Pectobacterium araliae]|uniref:NAD(P)-binding domain-containing protein n=1 Tax=Pectobacterium araliae TaxID=3073862 RepID=A0AAN0MKU0_9GAMM|nr:NAD(P)-binding domain-containing protein [Pectobacterium sp. MAFF 302110]GKW19290.1 NADPH-dependent F420 reductase [Pectobacterium carotovorum subsp. carotovorum]
MKIAVIGTGNMGQGFVKQLTLAGHEVRVTARDLTKARALADQYAGAVAVASGDALQDSDIAILAVGYNDTRSALQSLGDLNGKVIVDITNPLTADYMGLTLGHDTSAGEEIAKMVPGAIVVKAFNTIFAQVLADGAKFSQNETVPVFYATDSESAKETVRELIDSIGFSPVDAGGLKNARYLEPLGGLNIYFGYGAGKGTQISPTWISRS